MKKRVYGMAIILGTTLAASSATASGDPGQDAKAATQAALESGIVPGGGVALIRAEKSLDKLQLEGDEKLGAHHERHEPTDDQQRRHARILEGRAGPLTDNLLRDAL